MRQDNLRHKWVRANTDALALDTRTLCQTPRIVTQRKHQGDRGGQEIPSARPHSIPPTVLAVFNIGYWFVVTSPY